ncbi:hypothetical protein [Jatrophihabitans sp.]|jgi:hypothetical protein|uniref:hypothetical protein n=1 Tax=Jatrophihabitans sp. TaxID=1932789 RepID=UPI002F02C9D3
MVRNDHRLTGELVVTWQGNPVDHPAIATVRLENASKTDIGTVSFDGGRPVVLSFNANVLALLEPEATEKDGLLPVRLSGNTVLVGPGLLRHGGTLTVSALVDSVATCSLAAPLENVNVQEHPRESSENDLTLEFGAFGLSFQTRESLTALVSFLATGVAAAAAAIAAASAFKK